MHLCLLPFLNAWDALATRLCQHCRRLETCVAGARIRPKSLRSKGRRRTGVVKCPVRSGAVQRQQQPRVRPAKHKRNDALQALPAWEPRHSLQAARYQLRAPLPQHVSQEALPLYGWARSCPRAQERHQGDVNGRKVQSKPINLQRQPFTTGQGHSTGNL